MKKKDKDNIDRVKKLMEQVLKCLDEDDSLSYTVRDMIVNSGRCPQCFGKKTGVCWNCFESNPD